MNNSKSSSKTVGGEILESEEIEHSTQGDNSGAADRKTWDVETSSSAAAAY